MFAGFNAIILELVNVDAAEIITRAAYDANVPVIYIGREPANFDTLPGNQEFIDPALDVTLEAAALIEAYRANDDAAIQSANEQLLSSLGENTGGILDTLADFSRSDLPVPDVVTAIDAAIEAQEAVEAAVDYAKGKPRPKKPRKARGKPLPLPKPLPPPKDKTKTCEWVPCSTGGGRCYRCRVF